MPANAEVAPFVRGKVHLVSMEFDRDRPPESVEIFVVGVYSGPEISSHEYYSKYEVYDFFQALDLEKPAIPSVARMVKLSEAPDDPIEFLAFLDAHERAEQEKISQAA